MADYITACSCQANQLCGICDYPANTPTHNPTLPRLNPMTTTTTARAPRNWQHEPHVDAKGEPTGAIHIGSPMTAYGERRVTMLNPTERTAYSNPWGGRTDPRFARESPSYVLWFGAYGWTRLHVYAPDLDEALDACVDWLAEHEPDLLSDKYVHEEFKRLLAERVEAGADPNDEDVLAACRAEAEVDTTTAGNEGNYLNSSEWGVALESPTTAELYAYITGQ